MRILKTGVAIGFLTIVSACSTTDPMALNDAGQKIAMGYVETALSSPIDGLKQRAETGSAYAQLNYGLALMAGRGGVERLAESHDWVAKARTSQMQGGGPVIDPAIIEAAQRCAGALAPNVRVAAGSGVCGDDAAYARFQELMHVNP